MARSSIDCVYPDGSSFQATVAEARWIVANNLGEWGEQRVVRMKRRGARWTALSASGSSAGIGGASRRKLGRRRSC
jgi:hypothetical protein